MKKLIKHYIESYWWYFFWQAVIAIAFGLFALTTPIRTLSTIVAVAAGALVLMGVVGIIRMVHDYTRRPHRRWGDSLVIAIIELLVGLYFWFNIDAGFQVSAIIFGVLALARGIFDLVVALTNLEDSTDRFFWIIAGAAGIIIGLVILNHPMEASITMVWFFGLYILVLGLSNLFYALHLRSKLSEAERSLSHIIKGSPRKAVKSAVAKAKTSASKVKSGASKVRAKAKAKKVAKKSGHKK
jgi:uncharacterized membrane protein HdeD (DUF308 family)